MTAHQQRLQLPGDYEDELVAQGERHRAKRHKRRFCPFCGSPAQLVTEKIRWSRWRCQRCKREHLTCEWPGCGQPLPELELPLACPHCLSILNMDRARRDGR